MTQPTLEKSFEIAVRHHQAGQLPQAEQLYRRILAREPNHASASHNLGVLAHQIGREQNAMELIRHAISIKPDFPDAYCSLGDVLRVSGQLDEAIAALRQAIAIRPGYAAAYYNLGNALKDKGQLDEAIATYREAIAIKPDYLKAYGNLGACLQAKGQFDQAIGYYRVVIGLKPDSSEAHINLGGALKDKGLLDQAIAEFRRAKELDPRSAAACNNLGVALRANGQLDEAIAAYRQAIALRPEMHKAHGNLGNALAANGQVDEAIASNRQAIALKPDYAEAHRNLAISLLLQGDYARGWEEYEWRHKCRDFAWPGRNFSQPMWDGQPLQGATLLLYAEQGLEDTIQFLRYLPLASERGGKIILQCPAGLQPLLKPLAGKFAVVAQGQPIPAFEVHCPLLSLPRIFGTTLENIPRPGPYLRADPESSAKWRERMAADAGSFKVGLAWSDTQMKNNDRSVAPSALAPLSQLQGISFYSLQNGVPADQMRDIPQGLKLTDWTGELKDFADAAGLIANLDLVVAVDSAIVHLAGAMGKRAGALLQFACDWRWLLKRKDSPWYPSVRLFRQPSIGDWDSVIRQVTQVLQALRDKRTNNPASNA